MTHFNNKSQITLFLHSERVDFTPRSRASRADRRRPPSGARPQSMSRAAARLLARAAAAPAPAPAPPASARAIASAANDATFSFGKAQAQFYDDVLVDGIFKPWTESMFATSRPVAGDAVLDVACGTGVVARECAALVGESVGDGRARTSRSAAKTRPEAKKRNETATDRGRARSVDAG